MLQLRRAETTNRSHLFRREMGESLEHLLRAIGHAAGGVRATMEPRLDAAREYVGPAAARLRESTAAAFNEAAARQSQEREAAVMRRGMTRQYAALAGLLATGAAVGIAGALVVRRRRQMWEEYDASRALESVEEQQYSETVSEEPKVTGAVSSKASERGSRRPVA